LILFNLINDEISVDLLKDLKKKYSTLNWFGDDQWRYDSFSKKIAQYFTYKVTTDKFSVEKYKRDGHSNVILSQWGGVSLLNNNEIEEIEYENDFSFVGAYSPVREWIVDYLKSNGVNVNCFGFNWESGPIETSEMHRCFKKSRINLNLSNSVNNDVDFLKYNLYNLFGSVKYVLKMDFKILIKSIVKSLKGIKLFITYEKNSEQIKARNFEIPMAYGFQISNYALTLEDYYEIGKEIVVFNSKEELLKLCKYYINNNKERKKILHNSYLRSVEHTYVNRFKLIFNKINKI
jgi:spore maturation protein CgeB